MIRWIMKMIPSPRLRNPQYFTLYCSSRILRPLRSQLWRSKRSVQSLQRSCPWNQPGGLIVLPSVSWVFRLLLFALVCSRVLVLIRPLGPHGKTNCRAPGFSILAVLVGIHFLRIPPNRPRFFSWPAKAVNRSDRENKKKTLIGRHVINHSTAKSSMKWTHNQRPAPNTGNGGLPRPSPVKS